MSGKNKKIREMVDITGVRCREFCPKDSPLGEREPFFRYWSNATQWPNSVLPVAGDNVTVPFAWNIILDVSVPAFDNVIVNGYLVFDPTLDHTFEANKIWVNQGFISIGSKATPYAKKAKIILNGEKDDDYMVLDPDASGNKMLAVTGGIEFYGTVPDNIWTKLTKIAKVGDTTIEVITAAGWNVGDEIVVGPTYSGMKEDEVFTIVGISGNIITLDHPFVYEHYGDPDVITNSKGGQIDVRAAVGLLSRNIEITKGPDANNWGCRVLVYSYLMESADGTTATPMNGYAVLDGVEINGCGQYDTSYAALKIEKLGSIAETKELTSVTRCSIHNSNGIGLYIDKSESIYIVNNVFHYARRFLVIVFKVNKYTFFKNVLIGARERMLVAEQTPDTKIFPDTAAYEQYVPIKFGVDSVNVTRNLVQGSEGEGFVVSYSPCNLLATYNFKDNTAGSCLVAFVPNVNPGQTCLGAAGFYAYASTIGLMANPTGPQTSMIYQDMFFVDN